MVSSEVNARAHALAGVVEGCLGAFDAGALPMALADWVRSELRDLVEIAYEDGYAMGYNDAPRTPDASLPQ